MNDIFDLWNVETTDLTARVAAAIAPSVDREILEELRALRRELADLRAVTALLKDEVVRLRVATPVRRIVPFGTAEGLARLS